MILGLFGNDHPPCANEASIDDEAVEVHPGVKAFVGHGNGEVAAVGDGDLSELLPAHVVDAELRRLCRGRHGEADGC